jgi:hypothetical protein
MCLHRQTCPVFNPKPKATHSSTAKMAEAQRARYTVMAPLVEAAIAANQGSDEGG